MQGLEVTSLLEPQLFHSLRVPSVEKGLALGGAVGLGDLVFVLGGGRGPELLGGESGDPAGIGESSPPACSLLAVPSSPQAAEWCGRPS